MSRSARRARGRAREESKTAQNAPELQEVSSRLSLTPDGLATCNFLFSDVGEIACGIYSVNAVFTGIGFSDIQYNIP